MRVHLRRASAIGLLFGACSLISCGSRPDSQDWFKQEISHLQDRTIPVNCDALRSTDPVTDRMALVARWECDSTWDIGEYRQWVATRFEDSYKIVHSDSDRLVFGKNLGGDFESVDVEGKRVGEKLHIRVVLQTYPD